MNGKRSHILSKKLMLCMLLCMLCALLAACVPGDGSCTQDNVAGFFTGIWHGWIAPFSLVKSIFSTNARLYEVYNNGFSYDLGFYMAVISGFGGLALVRKKGKSK